MNENEPSNTSGFKSQFIRSVRLTEKMSDAPGFTVQASNTTKSACVDSFVDYSRILVLLRRAMPITGVYMST